MEVHFAALAIVLIVFQVGDAVAAGIPIKYISEDLDRLGCSEELQRIIPVVKAAAAAGLTIGLWVPLLGAVSCFALVGYFAVALWFHYRIHDDIARYVPAALLGVYTALVGVVSYLPGI